MNNTAEFIQTEDCERLKNQDDCFFFELSAFKRSLREEIRGRSLPYSSIESAAVKLSRRLSKSLNQPFGTFTPHPAALLFPVFIELCTVLPIKSLLKTIVFPKNTRIIIIPLANTKLNVGTVWTGENDLFEFYLAYELSKKYRVIFSLHEQNFDERIQLRLFPDLISINFYYKNGKLFTAKHLYRQNIVYAKIYNTISDKNPLQFSMHGNGLPEGVPKLLEFDVGFINSPKEYQAAKLFEFKLLFDEILLALLERIKVIWAFWQTFIKDNPISELHISDHVCFETGALLSSLDSKNTKVTCWPHASGMSHRWLRIFDEKEVALFHRGHIETGTEFPLASRSITKSELCFDDPPFNENFDPSEDLNVVIIGTARRLRDFSLLNQQAHVQCYSDILAELQKINFKINIFFRPKKNWETLEWFRGVTEFDIPEAPFSPSTHSLPNSIFICASLYGTALFEGITRGAHCILVETGDYYNYTNKNAERCIPVVPPSGVYDYINKFRDIGFLQRVWRQQATEFIASTSFDPSGQRQ